MTVVVFGIDALDPELVDEEDHSHLTLDAHAPIDTIVSSAGEPSTHELWPTIITGLEPAEHGLQLTDGVTWQNPMLEYGSRVADVLLPDGLQSKIGAWLLNNTTEDAFRKPATYYRDHGIDTVFDGRTAKPIGIPNYVTDPSEEDREHVLRRSMGELFERDIEAKGGHRSDDPAEFYELCMEMAMVRTALIRRGLRSRNYELVFGYTSGLDLVGHVSYDLHSLQERAYDEFDHFVADVVRDLGDDDELVLLSDHGLQDGVHTEMAMIASTSESIVDAVDAVTDVRHALEQELDHHDHQAVKPTYERDSADDGAQVKDQLEDLGYM
jgi:hypothetical protein